TLRGISKPGPIVWSRIYIEGGELRADVGRGHVVELPPEETERRWRETSYEWPIMHAVLHGVSRDQMMARHKSNHVQVAYAPTDQDADDALIAKAAFFQTIGISVFLCGDLSVP
ncbi:MAG: fucose isomerase, partial [Rhodothermales bacterium]|nr:fucose isomerase [Rhodothermales bacterium]